MHDSHTQDKAQTTPDGFRDRKNFTTKFPRTTLGTGLARTGTNTVHKEKDGHDNRMEGWELDSPL